MLTKQEFRVTTALSVLVLALVVANVISIQSNRTVQVELNTRNQFIQQTVQLEPIYQALVRSLADAASNGDAQIGTLLASQGITFSAQRKEGGK